MKTIVLVTLLLVTTTFFAQDKYDQFMQKIKIENEIKGYVNNYIDKLANQSNGVTAAQWSQIKTKIDYSPYFLGVKSVLMNNYTPAELDEIVQANDIVSPVNDTGQFIFKPKPVVKEQLYQISRTFGKMINVQIKKLIEKA
ncbi:hypothetical protein [Flavobacterium salmonis]|uniref:Uncharacterized protein n=1 Tax=Flavobacterium salmonis TaxID=2654844 RepID=A0A6V6YPE2_9FLAO|nr:hypothetical protein [Flavobacterium salmonis]CAD0001368.1 hypothetical protein FLAT13_00515 [Flavobacterium salmonis]